MAKDDIIAARLDMIAAKAKILADDYKNNRLWDGDLGRGLGDIRRELDAIGRNERGETGWATTGGGWQGDR